MTINNGNAIKILKRVYPQTVAPQPVLGKSSNFASPSSVWTGEYEAPSKLEEYAKSRWVRCTSHLPELYRYVQFKNRHKNAKYDPKAQRHHLALMIAAESHRELKYWLMSQPRKFWKNLNYEHIAMLDDQGTRVLQEYLAELAGMVLPDGL